MILDYQDVLDNTPASALSTTLSADVVGLLRTLVAIVTVADIETDGQEPTDAEIDALDDIRARAIAELS